ncbi:NAD(P)-binding protein [Polychaeton citri CBS 116435]|uniref:NAD(P)-binding protein n=1 Tax=Polychaeton citri CBS 116435 TaxID=1314669 RepID=A0A9P4QE47_9PEZI|nr:NAD(P)-binding protein [Polychaeton citri CBS 116435]
MATNEPTKILITGASGFLGNAITEALLSRVPPFEITTLDREPLRQSLDITRLKRHIIADITDRDSVANAFRTATPDLVVHTAGTVPIGKYRYTTSAVAWARVRAINYTGTRHVLDAALHAGCGRFLHTSSCTVVTDDVDTDYRRMEEEALLPLGNAKLFYGKSKALAEQYVLDPIHAETKGLKAIALRPATIIGPGDLQVISTLHGCIRNGETAFVVGDGDNIYDWMYIDNAVHAHLLAVENLLSPNPTAAGQAFFISNQEPVYFWDFLLYVWAQFGHVPPRRFHIPPAVAWVAGALAEFGGWVRGAGSTLSRGSVKDGARTHYASNEKAKQVLGYVPRVSLAEGVRRSCEAYKMYLVEKESKKSAQ